MNRPCAVNWKRFARARRRLKKTRMMFVVGRSPNRLDGLIVVGQASYLNESSSWRAAKMCFAMRWPPYPEVSLEEVLARNPDVIVDMGDMADTVGVTEEHKREVIEPVGAIEIRWQP